MEDDNPDEEIAMQSTDSHSNHPKASMAVLIYRQTA